MFEIDLEKIMVIIIVAVVVIGPKDMPRALRTAGRWIGKMRRVSGHFRAGLESMIREAELEDMEKTWRAQNEAIMAAHPTPALDALGQPVAPPPPLAPPASAVVPTIHAPGVAEAAAAVSPPEVAAAPAAAPEIAPATPAPPAP